MSPGVIALLALAGLVAGTVDAIAGGGGLITLPALLTAGLPPQLALGTNKGGSVWGSGIATLAFWRAGRVDRIQALFTFPLAFAGSAIGARMMLAIDKELLRPIVIAMLAGAAVLLAIKKPVRDEDVSRHPAAAAVLAFTIGAYDGFFGPGTGTFLIVGFVALCGNGMTRATANAKVVNFASNLAALATFAYHGTIVWEVALPMAAGQLCGGFLGVRLALRGGAKLIRVMVVVVSGALVVKLGYDFYSGL